MKTINSNLRSKLSPIMPFVIGIILAIVMFSTFDFENRAIAEEKWCPPPPGCANFGCFEPLTGGNICKFIAQQNGAECHVGGDCSVGGEELPLQ